MPALPDTMYCSEQICIPPTFPYLLRQYAKAAIRTQPNDLLRWSTAYFRCLSLNLRPPVKPRLEYPIPKSYFGITPGWLKALLQQLENNTTVPFGVLWDRWIGACLEHQNLVELLCIGGFTDPEAIPWYRFLAICAAHLTDNLTQTMILICEILTEEPEGGCAMIPLETFLDLYKFLANIDGGQSQVIINVYFTDALLSLYREPVVEKAAESISEIEEEVEEESTIVEEEEVVEVETGPVDDQIGVVISCPDIAPDDYKTEEYFLKMAEDGGEKSEEESELIQEGSENATVQTKDEEGIISKESVELIETEQLSEAPEVSIEQQPEVLAQKEGFEGEEENLSLQEEVEEEEATYMDRELEELKTLLAGPQEEMMEELEGEEKIKEEVPPEPVGEEIFVKAIPGIGPVVPPELVEAVVVYMKECAKRQHGMVMPRNIRHFSCPPLEILQY